MPIEILMPALSPTMTEGTLAKWHKKEGDTVQSGELIAEIETDKATMEVEAVDEGVIGKLLVKEGTKGVLVNQVIALLLEEGEDKKALADYKVATPEKKEEAPTEEAVEENTESAPATPTTGVVTAAPKLAPPAPKASAGEQRIIASPLARRMAKEAGIALHQVTGTGPKGRIVKADIEAAMLGSGGMIHRNPTEFFHVPHTTMRETIAKRLVESKQQVPHFYLTVDCEIDALLAARKDLNKAAPLGDDGKPLYRVSVNDFVIKAVAESMKKIPAVNASWYDDTLVQYNNIDISIAVATDNGLITPIVKNADQKTLAVISNDMKQLAVKAREGTLKPEEFQGGGFSISNLGMYGIKEFSAIINPPQACILAVGAGEEQTVVRDGNIEVATVMKATLSVDHRVVDGALGAEFLVAFKQYIEAPILLCASI